MRGNRKSRKASEIQNFRTRTPTPGAEDLGNLSEEEHRGAAAHLKLQPLLPILTELGEETEHRGGHLQEES